MTETTQTETVTVTINPPVTVEVIDDYERGIAEDRDDYLPEKEVYQVVELLSNGWVRCIGLREDTRRDDEPPMVNYYPPQRVNVISGVEEVDHDV